jgi:hypothetical protein
MRKPICVLVLVLLALAVAPVSAAFADLPPGGTFTDDDGNIFEGAIEAIAAEGITEGCNPPENTLYCPDDFVTRGEMAVFLVRAMGYVDNGGGDLFLDDDGLFYEDSADKLMAAGVTNGCTSGSPHNRFCGERDVTREVMAVFLVRAFGYTDDGGGNLFIDYYGTRFHYAVDYLFAAGIAQGCNPPVNDRFCPLDPVTRGQMAAFLHRALT